MLFVAVQVAHLFHIIVDYAPGEVILQGRQHQYFERSSQSRRTGDQFVAVVQLGFVAIDVDVEQARQ